MLAIFFFIFDLEALIRQVNIQIWIIEAVFTRGGAQVPLFIKVYVIFRIHHCPDSNIKLSLFIKQGSFNVFLNHTQGTRRSWIYKVCHLFNVREYFDTFALVHICRFHEPNIIDAMLHGKSFLRSNTSIKLSKSEHHFVSFIIVEFGLYQESGGCRIENSVIMQFSHAVGVIILRQASNQSWFGSYRF